MLKYPGQLVVEDGNYRVLLNLSFATFKEVFFFFFNNFFFSLLLNMQNEFGQNVTLYLTIFHDLVFKQWFFFM